MAVTGPGAADAVNTQQANAGGGEDIAAKFKQLYAELEQKAFDREKETAPEKQKKQFAESHQA